MTDNIFRSLERVLNRASWDPGDNTKTSPEIMNIIVGSMTVTAMNWLDEFLSPPPNWGILEDPAQQSNRPFSWWGWDELVNFKRIRHCFAHSMLGDVPENLKIQLEEFEKRLENKEIKHIPVNTEKHGTDELIRESYFQIKNNRIFLNNKTIHICYTLLGSYALNDPNNNVNSLSDLPVFID